MCKINSIPSVILCFISSATSLIILPFSSIIFFEWLLSKFQLSRPKWFFCPSRANKVFILHSFLCTVRWTRQIGGHFVYSVYAYFLTHQPFLAWVVTSSCNCWPTRPNGHRCSLVLMAGDRPYGRKKSKCVQNKINDWLCNWAWWVTKFARLYLYLFRYFGRKAVISHVDALCYGTWNRLLNFSPWGFLFLQRWRDSSRSFNACKSH